MAARSPAGVDAISQPVSQNNGTAAPPGSAALKVTLKVQGTNAPLGNTTVTIQAEGGLLLSGTTDASGEVSFDSIDPARYTVRVLAASGTIELIKEVDTGVNARLEVEVAP